ncbi:MAG: 16S rRNA (guanine(527)-N(7))-methyltransferase RsmG [Nitrospirota bacterium]
MNLKLLSKACESFGLPLSQEELRLFELYLGEILKWSSKVNLTAITEPDEIIVKHFLDSLALLLILPVDGGRGRTSRATAASQHISPALPQNFLACDIGSGAGFPGLALKVVLPGMDLTLVEPVHKKAVFLRQVIRTLSLSPVTALEARAEDLPDKISKPFDIVFSRAFKAPAELLPLAFPVLKDGGLVALSLGPGTEYEPQPGWTVEREEEITLPFSDIKRKLLLLKKI